MNAARRSALSLPLALVVSAPAFAQEFSADVTNRMAGGNVSTGKIYQTPDKTRFDMTVALFGKTMDTRMIIDRRARLIYVVQPQQKTILVNHVLELAGSPSGTGSSTTNPCDDLMRLINPMAAGQQFTCKLLGHEAVSGRSADKWQMDAKWLGGPALLWVDPQVRTAIKWTLADGTSGELQNISVGAQPASLFELPADYRRQDLPH
jgi:hypothetical protein